MSILIFLNPFRVIKNIFMAIALCNRYKIMYDPFCWKLEHGASYSSHSIKLNPFSLNFTSIFFHELVHQFHHKLVNYNIFFTPNEKSWLNRHYKGTLQDYEKVLEAEAFASRFAIKTGKVSQQYLIKSFNTYTAVFFKKNQHIYLPNVTATYLNLIHYHYLKLKNF